MKGSTSADDRPGIPIFVLFDILMQLYGSGYLYETKFLAPPAAAAGGAPASMASSLKWKIQTLALSGTRTIR
jgi:hypothetical protein